MSTNTADSIRARLKNRYRDTSFELVLVRYACERFLYRLGKSEARGRCILKGATLLAVWMKEPSRTTRDIDLLALGSNDEQTVRAVVEAACSVPCDEDVITFDMDTMRVSPIRATQSYEGQRARLLARLGTARIPVQIDFGFGDAVTSVVDEEQLPTLIDGVPAPSLRIYPKVATIAEKFEAMAKLGTGNSRMKDFYDVWALSETFQFYGPELKEAVARCFERRGTTWVPAVPVALTETFYSDPTLLARWESYGRDGQLLTSPPSSFEEIGDRVQLFLGPVLESLMADVRFERHWPAGGPWRPRPTNRAGRSADDG